MPCTGRKRALGKASWRWLWCEALLVRGLEVGAPADRLHGLCLLPQPLSPGRTTGPPLCLRHQSAAACWQQRTGGSWTCRLPGDSWALLPS